MSRPQNWWWTSVKAAIRHYPALRQAKEDLLSMHVTAAPGGGNGAHVTGINRTVERTALRELQPAEEAVLDAVRRAIEETEQQRDGKEHVRLVSLYYWGGMRLTEAADRCYIDERTAKRWNGDFVRRVARGLGYFGEQTKRRK